jgi:hypothetical protein
MSPEYRTLQSNVEAAKRIDEELRPSKSLALLGSDRCVSNTVPLSMQVGKSKRYKIRGELDQVTINRIRNQIQLKKITMQEG